MSMNLYLSASIKAQSHLGPMKFKESFELFQTPTRVTKAALRSGGKEFETYSKWLLRTPEMEGAEDHIRELEKWLKDHEGWDIEWYEL